MANRPSVDVQGCTIIPDFLDLSAQRQMVEDLRRVAEAAPFVRPVTPWGKPMSVRMTSAGRCGWGASTKGYSYAPAHPSGVPWPAIPESVLSVWSAVAKTERAPDCCLINYYDAKARMGLHQDKDEADFAFPVVSISLGDSALFRVGGTERSDSTKSIWLNSGDVAVLSGAARLAFHGIDRIKSGTSTLLDKPGRINVTLRVVY